MRRGDSCRTLIYMYMVGRDILWNKGKTIYMSHLCTSILNTNISSIKKNRHVKLFILLHRKNFENCIFFLLGLQYECIAKERKLRMRLVFIFIFCFYFLKIVFIFKRL